MDGEDTRVMGQGVEGISWNIPQMCLCPNEREMQVFEGKKTGSDALRIRTPWPKRQDSSCRYYDLGSGAVVNDGH